MPGRYGNGRGDRRESGGHPSEDENQPQGGERTDPGLFASLESYGDSSPRGEDPDDYVDLSPNATIGPRHLAYLCFILGIAALVEWDNGWIGLVLLTVGGAFHILDAALESDDLRSFFGPLLSNGRAYLWKVLGAGVLGLGLWDHDLAKQIVGGAVLGLSPICSLLEP